MPNLKDVVKLLSEQISNDELTAAISATDENVEISEEGFEDMSNQIKGLMTMEAAKNNQEIINSHIDKINKGVESAVHKELKANMMYQAEKKITDAFSSIGLDVSGKKFDEQIEAFRSRAPTLSKGEGVSEDAKKQIETLNSQLKTATEENKNLENKFNKKLEGIQIDTALQRQLDNYKLAEPYTKPAVKNGIYQEAISKVKDLAGFKLGSNGQLKITQKDNPEMDFYMGNEKIDDVGKLLAPHVQDYLKTTTQDKVVTPESQESLQQPVGNRNSAVELVNAGPSI